MSKTVRIAKNAAAERPEPSALPGPGAERAPRSGACQAETVVGVSLNAPNARTELRSTGRGAESAIRIPGWICLVFVRRSGTFGFEDATIRSSCPLVRAARRVDGAEGVTAGRAVTAGDPTFEEARGIAVGPVVVPACPETVSAGLFAFTEASRLFLVSGCAVAEPAGVDTFARTCTGTGAEAPPEDALASTAVPPTGVEESTVVEAVVSGDEATVASTEADGVETSTLAPVPSVETSAETEAAPRFADTETSGFFGGDEPAAALCACAAKPTSATTTRDTSARIRSACDTRSDQPTDSLERVIFPPRT